MISVCGVYCETECKAYPHECKGCNQIKGKVSWAKFYNKTVCPIYECVKTRKFKTCFECDKLPCKIWHETRNPELSDEELKQEINWRISNLKKSSKK